MRAVAAFAMRVALWPGSSFGRNPFVERYAESLRLYGIDVIDVQNAGLFEIRQDISVFHIHWPEEVFWAGGGSVNQLVRMTRVLRKILEMRRRRIRIVWMVHNIRPHHMTLPQSAMWAVYGRALARLTNAVMTLSPTTITTVRRAIPALRHKPAGYVPHPSYPIARAAVTRTQLRASLEIPSAAKVFCFFGSLRAYKGIEALIIAFGKLKQNNHRLIIAGEPGDLRYANVLKTLAAADERVILKPGRLSEEELAAIVGASDIIILPFKNYLHSGSLIYSLCASKPVLTPHTRYASDLMEMVGCDWIQLYESPLIFGDIEKAFVPSGSPDMSFATVDKVGAKAVEFYAKICGRCDIACR